MANIERFEDLVAWQKARQLTMAIYGATREGLFSKDFSLRDQIRGASSSIMSNIAEGFERGGRPEFHQFLVIVKGSCAEVRSQLYVAIDAGYLKETEFLRLQSLAVEVAKIVSALRKAVQRQRNAKS